MRVGWAAAWSAAAVVRRRGGRAGAGVPGRRLRAAADRAVGRQLLLDILLELGRDAVRGAALAGPAAGADRQHVDRHAADVGGDVDRDLRVDRDVRLVDLEVEREIVEHVREIDVDQRRHARDARATAEPALFTPSAAEEAVLQADSGSSAISAAGTMILRMARSLCFRALTRWNSGLFQVSNLTG